MPNLDAAQGGGSGDMPDLAAAAQGGGGDMQHLLGAMAAAAPIANPAPLGLFAFALTTAMLQMKHTRLVVSADAGVANVAWGFGIFYGGLAQFVAGLVEIKRNNIFGMVAFTSYGSFWMSISLIHIIQAAVPGGFPLDKNMISAMMGMWSVFTYSLFTLALHLNYTLSLLLFLLGTLFALLAGGVHNEACDIAAGWVGIATSLCAFYLAYVEMFNDIVGKGKEIIPLGRPRRRHRTKKPQVMPTIDEETSAQERQQHRSEDEFAHHDHELVPYAGDATLGSGAVFADCKTIAPLQRLILQEAVKSVGIRRRHRHHKSSTMILPPTLSSLGGALVREEEEEEADEVVMYPNH